MLRRLSARARLTLIYACLFLAAGVALIVVDYSLVSAGLPVPSPAAEPAGDQLVPTGGTGAAADAEIRVAVNESLTSYRAEVLHRLVSQSVLALVVALAISVALGWIVSGRVLRPLRDMTATASELTHGDLRMRLPVPGPDDEIRRLAETFNGMLDRLEEAFAQERLMVANLSHEIRTPLANQRVAIEVALDDPAASADELRETLEIVARENRRSQLVSERILHLAQAQGADRSNDERVALDALVRAAVERMPEGDVRAAVECAEVEVRGDAVLLGRLLDNLLENAVRYNVPDGRVEVELRRDGPDAVLRVANDGRVLTRAEAAGLAAPFRRSRATRGSAGAGLGLAIVAAVARRHGGELRLAPRDGGGLEAVVRLPAAGGAAG